MSSLTVSDAASAPGRVANAIATAASRTGVDFKYLFNQAKIESQLDPSAQAKSSSARGLFQFTRQSWLATLKRHGAEHDLGWAADAITQDDGGHYRVDDPAQREAIFGLRDQPEASSAMAAEFASDNEAFLGEKLGRSIEPVDLYLAHFLGPGGAARFLSAHAADPSATAAPLFPEAAAANRGVFFGKDGAARSLDEIRQSFAARLDQGGQAPWDTQFALNQSTVHRSVSGSTAASPGATLRMIEPMPARLSLDFARQAYQRLASLDGAGRS